MPFLAYELNLTAAQYEAVYEINLDYLMNLNGHADAFGIWWDRRNADRHMAMNTNRSNGGHFLRPDGSKRPEVERHRPCPLI